MDHQPTFRSHRDIQLDTSQFSTLPDGQRLDAVDHWQALVDAGLIGKRQPMSAENLANLARTEAILRGGALHRRQQAYAPFWVPAR
ncbi:MAG: hypothetical protein ABIS14_07740 [Sphingomonas sp.]